MPIQTKRAYLELSPSDGYRVLVDGLWPREPTKESLQVAKGLKEIAPSAGLRKWYGHRPGKWEEFRKKFRAELAKSPKKELLEEVVRRARREPVPLVFAARDAERCNATVIAEMIRERL